MAACDRSPPACACQSPLDTDGTTQLRETTTLQARLATGVTGCGVAVKVKVLEVDNQSRIRLSMKAVDEGEGVPAA